MNVPAWEKIGSFNIGKVIRNEIKKKNIEEIKSLLENFDKSVLSPGSLQEMLVAATEGNIKRIKEIIESEK